MPSNRPRLSRPYTPATPAQLEQAATITDGDVAHAAAQWQKDAPPAMRRLLDAVEETPPRRRRPGTADSGA